MEKWGLSSMRDNVHHDALSTYCNRNNGHGFLIIQKCKKEEALQTFICASSILTRVQQRGNCLCAAAIDSIVRTACSNLLRVICWYAIQGYCERHLTRETSPQCHTTCVWHSSWICDALIHRGKVTSMVEHIQKIFYFASK